MYGMLTVDEIVPDGIYPFADAQKLFASPHGGVISKRTFHRWREQRKFRAVQRGRWWYIRGAELLKLLRQRGE